MGTCRSFFLVPRFFSGDESKKCPGVEQAEDGASFWSWATAFHRFGDANDRSVARPLPSSLAGPTKVVPHGRGARDGQVDASAVQTGGSGARLCRPRAGQHCVPLSRPKSQTPVVSTSNPAFASLSLSRAALGCIGSLKSNAFCFSPLCRQVGSGCDVRQNELLAVRS